MLKPTTLLVFALLHIAAVFAGCGSNTKLAPKEQLIAAQLLSDFEQNDFTSKSFALTPHHIVNLNYASIANVVEFKECFSKRIASLKAKPDSIDKGFRFKNDYLSAEEGGRLITTSITVSHHDLPDVEFYLTLIDYTDPENGNKKEVFILEGMICELL